MSLSVLCVILEYNLSPTWPNARTCMLLYAIYLKSIRPLRILFRIIQKIYLKFNCCQFLGSFLYYTFALTPKTFAPTKTMSSQSYCHYKLNERVVLRMTKTTSTSTPTTTMSSNYILRFTYDKHVTLVTNVLYVYNLWQLTLHMCPHSARSIWVCGTGEWVC